MDGIDLSKPPDFSGDCKYVIYAEIRMKFKPYKGYIKPGLYWNEFIYSDIVGPIKGAKLNTKYAITFTEDITKRVNVALILSKEYKVILKAF